MNKRIPKLWKKKQSTIEGRAFLWQAIQDRPQSGVNLKKESEKEIKFLVCVGLMKQLRICCKLGLI
jgi:hypothetical protein